MNFLRRRPIDAYFTIDYAFSWAIGGLLVADYYGLLSVPHAIYTDREFKQCKSSASRRRYAKRVRSVSVPPAIGTT